MENTNIVLAGNILTFRKRKNLTQEEIAEKIGVTYQAVSNWENARSAPDVAFLPLLADIFDCTIDELFSRKSNDRAIDDLPWGNDGIIRGVIYKGRELLKSEKTVEKFTFEYKGEAKEVSTACNMTVIGTVNGACDAGNNVQISGDLNGSCNAGNTVAVSGDLNCGCSSGNTISIKGYVTGNCSAGNTVICEEYIEGNVSANQTVTVNGHVKAEIIKGNVTCNSCECEKIVGAVSTLDDNK